MTFHDVTHFRPINVQYAETVAHDARQSHSKTAHERIMAAGGALETLLSFLFVGALWGCTNPLIKRGSSESLMYQRRDNSLSEFAAQLAHVVKNWQFVVPFLLNQSGSVVYVYLLGSSEISDAVPICNSLTFVFTALTSRLLGETPRRPMCTYGGMVLILVGVAVCFDSKIREL